MRLAVTDALTDAAGRGGQAAVLGHPIGHSKSPRLHRAAYNYLGVDFRYGSFDLTEDQLPAFMASVRADDSWRGLSVTMPLKSAMAQEMDQLTPLARKLGVVNTVSFEYQAAGPARLTGHNTDVAGIVEALRHAKVKETPAAAILGGGGTATAAIAALTQLGASEVRVYVRSVARAGAIAELADQLGVRCELVPWDGVQDGLAANDVVISTLPPGAADDAAGALEAAEVGKEGAVLLDAAYDPWPSRLSAAWTARGGTAVHGLEMLLYQAVEQVRIFTGPAFHNKQDVINVMCDAVDVPRR